MNKMADIKGFGYNSTLPVLLYHYDTEKGSVCNIVRATLIGDIFSTSDYVHQIQFVFNDFDSYEPSRGDIMCGIDFPRTGGQWNMLDAFTSQNLRSFVPLGLTGVDSSKNVYTFTPLLLLSGEENASMFDGGVYQTTTFSGIDILKGLLFGAANWWDHSAGCSNISPFATQKNTPYPVVTVQQGLNAKIPSRTVTVDKQQSSNDQNPMDNITEATEYSFDPLDIYKELVSSQIGGISVIYYCPAMNGTAQLRFENDNSYWGSSDWKQLKNGVLVSADALDISEINKEDYKNSKDKHNVVETYYNYVSETKDSTGKTIAKEAHYATYKMVAKTSEGYMLTSIDPANDTYKFVDSEGRIINSASVPAVKRIKISSADDHTALFESSSKLDYLWDKPFSFYTIKANLSNSFLITQTKE